MGGQNQWWKRFGFGDLPKFTLKIYPTFNEHKLSKQNFALVSYSLFVVRILHTVLHRLNSRR